MRTIHQATHTTHHTHHGKVNVMHTATIVATVAVDAATFDLVPGGYMY